MIRCKNCDHEFLGQYCPDCGQRADTGRFNFRYMVEKFFDSFDLDRGFFHTLFVLIYKPGSSIREYVVGGRIGYYNPLKLFFITGAVATFVTFKMAFFNLEMEDSPGPMFYFLEDASGYGHYSAKYFSFFSLDAVPFFALFSWWFFRSAGFNYLENLIMNIYVAAGQFVLIILYAPVMIYFHSPFVLALYAILNVCYNIWTVLFFFRAFDPKGWTASILAVLIPQIIVPYLNYFFYRLVPQAFWEYLDLIFG